MAKYKIIMNYSDGTDEEQDEVFSTEEEAMNYAEYLCGCYFEGAEILNLSNPGDYPLDLDDDVDFEIIKEDDLGGKIMAFTNEEKGLLLKLARGLLDGMVGNERVYRGYKNVYCGKYIKDGEPVSYREGESARFFNGKENERIPGKRTEERYSSDEEKLSFLQRYGWLINDEDVQKYSAKFKANK